MRFITTLLMIVFALAILIACFANRHVVTVTLWPELSAYGVPAAPSVSLPMFVVALSFVVIGFILGAGREYLREGRVRRDAYERRQEIAVLEAQLRKLKAESPRDDTDELIAALPR